MQTFPYQLPSGSNIIPNISGINNLGSINYPFSEIYAKTGYFTNVSGMSPISILSDTNLTEGTTLTAPIISGTTISGDTISIGTTITAQVSGTLNIASATYPFNYIYGIPILQSADGSYWKLTVDNAGVVSGVAA